MLESLQRAAENIELPDFARELMEVLKIQEAKISKLEKEVQFLKKKQQLTEEHQAAEDGVKSANETFNQFLEKT
jgi:hypothetical protein